MSWFTLGNAEAETKAVKLAKVERKTHPAVLAYEDCRATRPVETTPSALGPSDPCWSQLVALRRYQGRDPLGRDVYGRAGLSPQDLQLREPNWAEVERTGRYPLAASQRLAPPVIMIVQAERRLEERKRALEETRNGIEERKQQRNGLTAAAPVTSKEWQIAAAALAIGVTIGKLLGKKGRG